MAPATRRTLMGAFQTRSSCDGLNLYLLLFFEAGAELQGS